MRLTFVFSDIGHYHHARFLAAAQHAEVSVLQMSGRSEFREFKRDGTGGAYRTRMLYPELSYDEVYRGRGVSPARLRRDLTGALAAEKPDVVFVKGYSFTDCLIALRWCAASGVPAVVLSETQARDFARVGWRESIKRRVVNGCSAAVVGGTPHRDYMIELGMEPERVFPGYDVVDNAHFAHGAGAARADAAARRAALGLPARYFLASGRFIEKKNVPALVGAYADYRQQAQGDPWDLVILGDGAGRPAVEAAIAGRGVSSSVQLAGFKSYEDLPAWYGLAGAFVHASLREQWGLVVNEAMAAGLPVIVSEQSGCAADLVEDGVNGFRFDAVNGSALTKCLLDIASDAPRAAAMGEASSRIISRWSPELFGKGIAAAARIAMERPRRASLFADRPVVWGLERLRSFLPTAGAE